MAESPPYYPGADIPCEVVCNDDASKSCLYTCVYPVSNFSPPPLTPPTHPAASSHTHVGPFLIATICILGISFLFLTTCTIILRLRFTRRRRDAYSPEANSGDSIIHDGDDHPVVDHPIWHITTVGLQQSVIDSITSFKYHKLDGLLTEGSDCSVCLSPFDEGDYLRLLPKCTHAFHLTCIDTWLRSHTNCPVCRAPVVNDSFNAGVSSFTLVTEDLDVPASGEVHGEGSSGGDRGDDFGELSLEGIRIAEILKKNRELRVLSDLAVNYRFQKIDVDEENETDVIHKPVKRSFSYNAIAASTITGVMSGVGKSEGSSSGGNAGGVVVEEKGIELQKAAKRGTSMSGLWMIKSSSIGRSLQKGPVSMKRSLSSGKLFSFRRTKSQASILPL